MNKGKQTEIIQQALGKASVLFMSQKIKGTEIEMPTDALIKIANETVDKLNSEILTIT